jgi:hypothetical protein
MSKYSFAVDDESKEQCLFFGLTAISLYAALSLILKYHYIKPEMASLMIVGWTAGFIAEILNIDLLEKPVQYFLLISLLNIPSMLFLASL